MRAAGLGAQGFFAALTSDMYDHDDPLLIEHLLRSILPRRGIAAREDEVLLTMGAQIPALDYRDGLAGAGRRAVVENPGYSGLRGIFGPVGGDSDLGGC